MPRAYLHYVRPSGLPPSLAGLRAPCYVHVAPRWKVRSLLAIALGVSLTGISYAVWRLVQGRAGIGEAFMSAFLLVFVVVLLRPPIWRPHISLAADERGLFFIGTNPVEPPVFVAWSEVGAMIIERRSTGQEGRARTVVVHIDDASAFWKPAKASGVMRYFIGDVDAEGRRAVAIGSAGLRPDDTLAALEALRLRALQLVQPSSNPSARQPAHQRLEPS